MNDYLGLAALVILVLLNGFFVATEYALVSVRRTRIDQLALEGNRGARRVQHVLENLDLYIASVQLGVSIASIALGFVAEPAIEHLTLPLFQAMGIPASYAITVSIAFALVLTTILHVVFGELFPKSAALQRSEQVALRFTPALVVFTAVFRLVILGLNKLGAGVLRLFGFKPVAGHHTAHSEEEIRMIVSASSQEGVLEDDEKELVYNALDLSDTALRTIMTPRVDMITIDAGCTLRAFLHVNDEHGYSRVPVYQDSPDNVIGVVHTQDVLKYIDRLDDVTVGSIARPTYFAPEGMRVSDLLKTLRERKTHLAVIVDEFGGTAGLVTLEDVLEEIVGEIYDETDEVEENGVQIVREGEFVLDATLSIGDAEEALGVELDGLEEAAEFETVAGFVTEHFGYIPNVGERFEHSDWTFIVEAADQRRVTLVRALKGSSLPTLEGGASVNLEART
ncbi:hemolysin family protein [Deinococcus yavapaiensis]|uniref:CBS domain containing-hemolysin-like protein n=1 Tax=Deinococcus yavapaiensis KR-236 TaxID=694435 RepID=A0A318SCN6_9DEIO|nr:hemolysin family protein [Deinococcus yavapaiensis]PYE56631.1 CBS domain containing-hemolysin-like protein [Deinococcus yavapaiensis KR-236]